MVWWNPKTWALDPKWPIISAMPTTQIRMLFLCGLDLITFIWFARIGEEILRAANKAGAVTHADPLILELFAAWLAFLAGCHGFSYAGYKTKRNTSWGDQNVTEDASDSTHIVTTEMQIPAGVQLRPTAPSPIVNNGSEMPSQTPSPVLASMPSVSGSFRAPPPPPAPKLVKDD